VLVWGHEKGPSMKGKRYTTEDKIRILLEPTRPLAREGTPPKIDSRISGTGGYGWMQDRF
jgi:hypothetical protein